MCNLAVKWYGTEHVYNQLEHEEWWIENYIETSEEARKRSCLERLDAIAADFVTEVLSKRPRWGYNEAAEERSEEHTSELQSLMRISYAVFCLKKNTKNT